MGAERVLCRRVLAETGSRLHAGFHEVPGRFKRWSSLGIYIDTPKYLVETWRCSENIIKAPREYSWPIQHTISKLGLNNVCVKIHQAIPRHRGFGSTTQLVLAVASSIYYLKRGRPPTTAWIHNASKILGRGKYSLVGTILYTHGGIVADAGAPSNPPYKPMFHSDFPDNWRIILVDLNAPRGIEEGRREEKLMESLQPAPERILARMREGYYKFVSGIVRRELETVLEGLSILQSSTGSYFSIFQGGVFRSDIAAIVDELWRDGIFMAQSSWGPTLYTIVEEDSVESDVKTIRLVAKLLSLPEPTVEVVQGRNMPATLECLE